MAITVKQFLDDLKIMEIPDSAVIIMASDAEGNEMQPLEGLDPSAYWQDPEGLQMTPRIGSQRAIVLFPEHR